MINFSEYYKKNFKIYVDLDGVLVDFERGAKEILGSNWKEISKNETEFWRLISPPNHKNFFGGLEWMSDGHILWNFIKKYHPTILTGVGNAWAHPQKRQWVQHELGANQPLIITRSSKKYEHAKSNHILIDDRADIIRRWKQHGGVGIRHKSAEQTITQLQSLGLS